MPTTITHRRSDDVVPIQHSRRYAKQYSDHVHLIEVDSDHLLHDQMGAVWEHLQDLLGD